MQEIDIFTFFIAERLNYSLFKKPNLNKYE